MAAEGKVSILFTVLDKTDAITVNALELDIDKESVRLDPVAPTKDVPGVRGISYKNQSQLLVIQLDTELPLLGKFKVQIKYRTRVDLEPRGIYAFTYANADGKIWKTAATYFNNGLARRAFPCFDELSFKATFNLTLLWKASESFSTWSNTEIWYQEPRENGIIADVYKRTPKMSTHDLAFAVGNYAYIQNVTSSGVKFRTVSAPGDLRRLQLFHKHGPAVFDWFENTFGSPYPLTKYDNVVVRNAEHGVVGHLGMTTFRESLVSTEEGVITEQRLARLITQGVSHQWFGGLVTPAGEEWAWLSRGIATFLDSYALAKIYPEWREIEMFVAKVHTSMKMDVDISRPVSITSDRHDQITREKGGSIFRMCFYTLGEEATLRGLNTFLRRHQYGSVTFTDLWTVLDEVARDENVTIDTESFLDPWLTQKHFPMVTVQRSRSGSVHIKQELFRKDMSSQIDSGYAPYGYMWDIPITITSSVKTVWNTASQHRDILWLRKSEPEATFHNLSIPNETDPDGWFLVNPDVIGYYRVNYDDRNWQAILKQLKRDHTVFSAKSRSQIINDAFALYKSRALDVTIALATLDYLQHELDYLPWLTALREIGELDDIMDRTRLYDAFEQYMKDRLKAAFQHCGLWANIDDVPMDMLQRKQIAEWACRYRLQACLDAASVVFIEWTEGKRWV
ncbi:thyrotropin-releasing hormone-degrading ectoenzyme-like [Haliotis rubra]|uniref:thyrotropin-releasing hormone-degrading ectoenzyme-like n=1 Tax=Haliotis rubra TaxID=36100 RepID=UPI001EE4EBAA|nr:thyrotropin-releasing hormone-degrading ectoenzyme-like [Haliotis rubra]